MNDDRWLFELGEEAREQMEEDKLRLDERWDRLAAGGLSAEEEAELAALSAASPEAADAYEAFRPLGEDFHRRVAAAVRAAEPAAGLADPEVPALQEGRDLRAPAARVLPFRSRALRAGGWLAAAAAAAAMALFFLRGPAVYPPLPAYAPELSGGVQALRGEPAGMVPRFETGSRFELVVRPETAVAGPLDAACFLVRDGIVLPWEAPIRKAEGGALRIAGTLGRELSLPPGEWTLWVFVGRPGRLPAAREVPALLARPPASAELAAVSHPLRVR